MPAGTVYTCPMHPEIEQVGPGDCPICGMALEPKGVPPADAGPNPELVDFRRRFAVGAALTVPLVVLAMGPMLGLPVRRLARRGAARWLELAARDAGGALVRLAVPRARRPLVPQPEPQHVQPDRDGRRRGLRLQRRGDASRRACSPPASATTIRARSAVYFEAAAVIVVLVLLGQILELRARERTGSAIRALLDLAPPTARLIRADGREEEVPLAAVAVGDRLRVRPGEKVPVDGTVVEGRSSVDEIDADRRAGAGREGRRRPGDRRAR